AGRAPRLQTLAAFPRGGTPLLCSSSSRNVSIAPTGERHTMFSGALLEVLRRGDPAGESLLSLEAVGARVSDLIRDRYDDRGVRPEVHSPDQREEDIARMPLFPNPAKGSRAGLAPAARTLPVPSGAGGRSPRRSSAPPAGGRGSVGSPADLRRSRLHREPAEAGPDRRWGAREAGSERRGAARQSRSVTAHDHDSTARR